MGRGGGAYRQKPTVFQYSCSYTETTTCYVTTLTIIVLALSIPIVGDYKTSKVSLRKDNWKMRALVNNLHSLGV